MTKKLQPKLRFREFTDDWEQHRFSSVFDFLKTNSYSRANLESRSTGIVDIHYGDILVNYDCCLSIDSHTLPTLKDPSLADVYRNDLLMDGDVVIADTAEDQTAGKCVELFDVGNRKVLAGLHTIAARSRVKLGEGYSGFYLSSPAYRRQLIPQMQGTKVIAISKNTLKNTVVALPRLDEQLAIGCLLKKFDALIAAEKRKLNLLKDKKTAFLQQIFDQKIRFKGFADPWKQQKLGELISNGGSGGTPSSKVKDYYIGNIPFLNISDITMRNIQDSEKHISKRGLESCHAWIVPAGSISLTMYASVGKVGILMQPMATSQAFYNLCFSDDSLRDFIYSRLEKAQIFSEWNPYIATGTQGNLNANAVRSFKIDVPEFEEIRLISILFTVFDTLVSAEKQKIDLLNLKKKALLRQMFV